MEKDLARVWQEPEGLTDCGEHDYIAGPVLLSTEGLPLARAWLKGYI